MPGTACGARFAELWQARELWIAGNGALAYISGHNISHISTLTDFQQGAVRPRAC